MLADMSRDARQRARRYYEHHNRDFQEDIQSLSEHHDAVIIWLPQLVVLATAVNHHHAETWDTLTATSAADCDAWYVHLLIGELSLAMQVAQRLTPRHYLCFHRGLRSQRPHIHRFATFITREHIARLQQTTSIERTHTMGFMKTPSIPTAPETPPPTVTITESSELDTQQQYDALSARRKGMLSTMLAGQAKQAASTTGGSSSTLG